MTTLTPYQLAALARLAADPAAFTEPATLSLLRKRGLVRKTVAISTDGRQKTTSPITGAGRAMLPTPCNCGICVGLGVEPSE